MVVGFALPYIHLQRGFLSSVYYLIEMNLAGGSSKRCSMPALISNRTSKDFTVEPQSEYAACANIAHARDHAEYKDPYKQLSVHCQESSSHFAGL